MAVQYVIGKTGSGKSYHSYEKILFEAEKNPKKKYYVIVPEQYNLSAQRDLVMMSKHGGIMNVDVLSFMRLAYRVFEELGSEERLILEDMGKNMIVRKLLNKLSPDFKYFKRASGKQGFTEEMKSLITEFMQYNVGLKELESLKKEGGLGSVLHAKLHDAALIYEAFSAYKEEGYIAAEKIAEELCRMLDASDILTGATFVFDGFTGFTPTQLNILSRLIKRAEESVFCLTMDEEAYKAGRGESHELFYLSTDTVARVNEIAIRNGVRVAAPFLSSYKKKAPGIEVLENGLFRPFTGRAKEGEEDVVIRGFKDPREEVPEALKEVLHLVRDCGYRYRELAIVTSDIGEYGELIKDSFEKAGVPVFIDAKKSLAENPFAGFIRAVLSVILENFSEEAVSGYLRSGFSGIWRSRADVFENYILRRGIKGRKRYETSFLKKETEEKRSEKRKAEEETAEFVREKIYRRFQDLLSVFKEKNRTVADKTKALYQFIKDHHAEEKLFALGKKFEAEGKANLAKEYFSAYRLIMEVLEKMHDLLGDEVMGAEDYEKILEAGFEEVKAGFIPPGLDHVLVGDIERTRLSRVKVLFCLGFNEGKVPKVKGAKGLLTDREREKLLNAGTVLAPTAKERTFREQFYLYMAMTKPEEKLFVSFSHTGTDGKTARPSSVIGRIKSLFSHDPERGREEEDFVTALRKDRGMGLLREALGDGTTEMPEVRALARYYSEKKDKAYTSLIKGSEIEALHEKIAPLVAKRLYGKLTGNITRLETFYSCPFSHFLSYGLGLRERERYTLSGMDLGNVFHDVLERFAKKTLETGKGFHGISEEERRALTEESVKEAVMYGDEIFFSTARNRYMTERIKRLSERTTWAIIKQVQAGDFAPYLFEEAFLSEGMKGRIDRVDSVLSEYLPDGTLLKNAKNEALRKFDRVEYVRVIDYKSGNKEFDLPRIFYGLDLQLFTYLNHVKGEIGKKKGHENNLIIPAGAYYYCIDDPVIEKGQGREAIFEALKLRGGTLRDTYPISLMDRELAEGRVEDGSLLLKGGESSGVIGVGIKKDGNFRAGAEVYSETEMRELLSHTEKKILLGKAAILSGEIAAKPYLLGSSGGCDYCPYKSICRFDTGVSGYEYRKLKTLERDSIFEKIRENDGKDRTD